MRRSGGHRGSTKNLAFEILCTVLYCLAPLKTTKVKSCHDAIKAITVLQYILHKKNVVAGYTPILGRGAIQYTRFSEGLVQNEKLVRSLVCNAGDIR